MKVVLLGYYGYGNLGDDLMMQAASGVLAASSNIAQMIVFVDSQSTLVPLPSPKIIYSKLNGFFGKLRLAKEILFANRVIWGGGTCLYAGPDGELSGLRFLSKVSRYCKFVQKPIHFCGIGIGFVPLGDASRLVSEIIADSGSLVFRDEASLARALELGADPSIVSLGGDIFFMAQRQDPRSRHDGVIRKISFSGVEEYSKKSELVKFYSEVMKEWILELGVEILFLPMHQGSNSDNGLHEAIASYLPIGSYSLLNYMDPLECSNLMQQADFHVGMRLHSLALADCLGIPNIAIEYSTKVAQYVEKSQMGSYPRLAQVGENISSNRILNAAAAYVNNTGFLDAERSAAHSAICNLSS